VATVKHFKSLDFVVSFNKPCDFTFIAYEIIHKISIEMMTERTNITQNINKNES